MGFVIRAAGEVSLLAISFLVLILGISGMILTSRKNLLLGKLLIFKNLLAFLETHGVNDKTLRIKAASKMDFFMSKILRKFH